MSRYDVDKFNPTPDPDLVCCICTCILDKPLVSPCQHVFCKVCIQTWLDRKKTCPTCRTRLTKDELRPVLPLVRNMLNRLTMVCDFKENGCDHVLNMEQFDGHIRECEFEMVTCRYDRCLKRLLKRDIRSHEDEDCDFKEITCSSCQLDVPVKEMHVHDCVVALKTCLKGLKKTIEELNKVLKASKEEVSNLTKKLEEQRWHALDDSWDSSSSWQSWDSHTDLSGSYTYSDDDRSINAEDNSPFQHLHLLPSASPSFMFHASDPLGLNSSFTPTTRSNTLNRDVFDVGLPSISVSTSTTVLPSFTNTRVMTSHSQDDTLSASENSDNSNRHRRRQNQRLVSERPHTDTSQGRSFLDVYTSFGTAVEEAFRNSAQSVPQSRHPQESVNEAWNAPSAPRGTILTFGSSAGVEHTIFKSNPSSPVEHSVYISPFRVHHSRSRSRSSERSRNSLNRHYFSRSSDRTSRRRSRSDERSVSSRSVSSESDARSRAESDRSRSLEHSFHSGTKSSENGDRSRSMSCSTQSSDYFSRSKSRSYERSTRSRSESYEHSARSRSESSERSVRSRSKRSERSTRSRSKSSEHSWSRSSQHSVRSWLQSLKNRSRSRSSECSDKSLSRQSDTRSGSRLSEHSGRNMYRSSHRRRSRSRSEDSDRRRSWLSENSNLSDNTSNRSLSSRLSHRKLYRSHYSRSRSRSQYSGRTKSLSEYSSRSRSECDNSSKCKSRSFHSEHSAKRRSRSPDKRRRISRTVLDSSSSESSSNGSRLSSKCFKKRFRSALRRDSRNWKSASDVKSNSSNNSRSEKKPYRSEKRGCSSSSSDNSTVVGSSLSPNVGSGGARQNLETLKSTKQQSVLPFLKTSLSELANCLLKNCPSSQNSNKSARKVLPSNSKKKSARNVTNVITDTNNISDNDSVNTNRNLPGISAVLTTAGLIENSHPATVTSTTEPLHSNINCEKKNSLFAKNSLVVPKNIEPAISNPRKHKKGIDHDLTEAKKAKRVKGLTIQNECNIGDTKKVNVEKNLSLLNCSGELHAKSSASSLEQSSVSTGKSRSITKTNCLPSSTKCSSDVKGKKSNECTQKTNESNNALDSPSNEDQTTMLGNVTKQVSSSTNSPSNLSRSYSLRRFTIEKVLAQCSDRPPETSREGTRRSSRRQAKPCNSSCSPALPSYFLDEDSDTSWTPDGLNEESDVSLSDHDSSGSDSSYEVQVPKPLMQIIDEMVDDGESDRSWTADS